MSPVFFLGLFTAIKWIQPRVLFALLIAIGVTAVFVVNRPNEDKASSSIDFVKKMDPERYHQIVSKQNEFEKQYLYILGERRPCHQGISTLHQLREETIQLMESSILTFPQNFKHIYGRNPDEELAAAIEAFRMQTRQQLDTVHRFCHDRHSDIPYRSEVIQPKN